MKTLPFAMPVDISVYLVILNLHSPQVQVLKTGKKLPIQMEDLLHIVDLSITGMQCWHGRNINLPRKIRDL